MDQQLLQLTGANTIRKDRSKQDFYPTPPPATIALLRFLEQNCELFQGTIKPVIWEPACGEGDMVRVFQEEGYQTEATDITTGDDFFTTDRLCNAIITNPPFYLADEFIKRATSIVPVSAMLLKSQYWHAKKRLPIFKNTPPAFVCPLTWRVDFLNGAKGGRPTMEVQWSIWIAGETKTKYIPLSKPK